MSAIEYLELVSNGWPDGKVMNCNKLSFHNGTDSRAAALAGKHSAAAAAACSCH